MNMPIRSMLSTALLVSLAACGGSGSSRDPLQGATIAPNCSAANCAEVEVSVDLECWDPVWETDFDMTTRISGRTTEVDCWGEENGAGGLDLGVGIAPENRVKGDASEAWFRIRGYAGPGTYPLVNLDGEGDHHGLKIIGNASRPEGQGNQDQAVGTTSCRSSGCVAKVAEGSEPIPNDPMATHEFRVRVEIECPAGDELTDMYCPPDDPGVSCSFSAKPTLRFDLLCAG